jgi:hypothetical protein
MNEYIFQLLCIQYVVTCRMPPDRRDPFLRFGQKRG